MCQKIHLSKWFNAYARRETNWLINALCYHHIKLQPIFNGRWKSMMEKWCLFCKWHECDPHLVQLATYNNVYRMRWTPKEMSSSHWFISFFFKKKKKSQLDSKHTFCSPGTNDRPNKLLGFQTNNSMQNLTKRCFILLSMILCFAESFVLHSQLSHVLLIFRSFWLASINCSSIWCYCYYII